MSETKKLPVTVTLSRSHVAIHEAAHLVIADEFWGGQSFRYRPVWVVVHPSGRSGQKATQHFEDPDPVERAIMAMGGIAANIAAIRKGVPGYRTYTAHVTGADGEITEIPIDNPGTVEDLCVLGAQHDFEIVDADAERVQEDPTSFRQAAYDRAREYLDAHWSLLLDVATDLEVSGAYYGTEAMVVVRAMKAGDREMLNVLEYYRVDRRSLPPPEGWHDQAGDMPWREPFQDWLPRRYPGRF